MPSTLSPAAKTNVAATVAVVMAGVTAWQVATRDGFTWWDLIPVAAAVLGVATTDHVENTIGSPKAKTVVHGALSLLAGITAAVAAVAGPEPSGMSAVKVAVAALGTLAVWYVPELAPTVRDAEVAVTAGAPAARIVRMVVGDIAASMGPDLPVPAPAAPAAAPAVLLPSVAAPAVALPIHDATTAALTDTAPLPAVTA